MADLTPEGMTLSRPRDPVARAPRDFLRVYPEPGTLSFPRFTPDVAPGRGSFSRVPEAPCAQTIHVPCRAGPAVHPSVLTSSRDPTNVAFWHAV